MTPLDTAPGGTDRRADLGQRLDAVRARISAATAAAGRTDEPQLVVVTKFFPAADVRLLHGLGVRDVGENRDQEASAKAAELGDLELEWHFIGQLQANKAKSVVRYARAVHSVDRVSLANALGKAMRRENERRAERGAEPRAALEALIQVDLRDAAAAVADGDGGGPARGGAAPSEVRGLADKIAATEGLELRGVMAVAPLGEDPAPAFDHLARISAELRSEHPQATWISAGMSHDLEQAVAAGATHLRVGSDVLGPRPPVL